MSADREREQNVRIIVRKKKGHGGHHGGAWKVAFADFMTAMFALFLVLWLVNQSSDVKSAIAGYFADPLGRANEFGSSILEGEGAQAANARPINEQQVTDLRRDRLQQLGDRIRRRLTEHPELAQIATHVEITLTDEGLHIELLEDSSGVFFQSGDARPSDAGRRILEMLGTELGTLPLPVVVEGHTDAKPYASPQGYTNWELSADRANAARRILAASGVNDSQMAEVRGFADRHPRVEGDPYADANRRVAILMLLPAVAEDTTGLALRAPDAGPP